MDFPTRENNILDLVFTNRPSLINNCHPLSGISDHEIVFVATQISAKIQRPIQRKIFLWSKANLDDIKLAASNLASEFINNHDIDTPVEILSDNFKTICDTCLDLVPSKLSSTRLNQPWVTGNIKSLSRRKQRSYNRARTSNTSQAWADYYELKRQAKHECRKAYNRYISNLVDTNNSVRNSKKFWSFIKHQRKDQCEVPPLFYNGITHTDNLTKANILNEQFTSVFKPGARLVS